MERIKIGSLAGLDGKSAYQAALDCGATTCETEAEWIASLTPPVTIAGNTCVLGNKQLIFNQDGTVTWIAIE